MRLNPYVSFKFVLFAHKHGWKLIWQHCAQFVSPFLVKGRSNGVGGEINTSIASHHIGDWWRVFGHFECHALLMDTKGKLICHKPPIHVGLMIWFWTFWHHAIVDKIWWATLPFTKRCHENVPQNLAIFVMELVENCLSWGWYINFFFNIKPS